MLDPALASISVCLRVAPGMGDETPREWCCVHQSGRAVHCRLLTGCPREPRVMPSFVHLLCQPKPFRELGQYARGGRPHWSPPHPVGGHTQLFAEPATRGVRPTHKINFKATPLCDRRSARPTQRLFGVVRSQPDRSTRSISRRTCQTESLFCLSRLTLQKRISARTCQITPASSITLNGLEDE